MGVPACRPDGAVLCRPFLVLASALYLTGVLAEDKTEVKVEDIHDSISHLIDQEKTKLREKREVKKKKKKSARRRKGKTGKKVSSKKGRRRNNSARGNKKNNTKNKNLKRRKDRKNRVKVRSKAKNGKGK